MRHTYQLNIVASNHYQFELVKRAVFSHYAPVDIRGLPQNYRDTTCEYMLSAESESCWRNTDIDDLRLFIQGVIAASKCI